MENVIVPPDPRRLINGLRDTGYTFNVAVADLVDNSISAGADKIFLDLQMDYAGEITFQIIDNGRGMTKDELKIAMQYGSPRQEDPRSLSKFGLGMKTASTSFCRRLSVISRGTGDSEIHKATWDLDHVESVGEWELILQAPTKEEIRDLEAVCQNNPGTMVKWSKVDRLLKNYADPGGNSARKALAKTVENLKEHLSMVYQRFLDTNDLRESQKVRIWVKDEEVFHWDPFCEYFLEPSQEEKMKVQSENGVPFGEFTIRAFILPRKEEFPPDVQASKAKISNELQGIYVYRENRLIHDGDWLGMFTSEPHQSLLRVEFSFSSDLDSAFNIDIKKSRISLNTVITKWLKDEFLPPVRREADERYRKGKKKQLSEKANGAHGISNRNIQDKEGDIDQAAVEIINAGTDEVRVTSHQGVTTLRLIVEPEPRNPGEFFVDAVDSIEDGLLWQPALIGQKQAVQINKGHPYYQKVYMPCILDNRSGSITIEGMDALLWALSIAELKVLNTTTKEYFNELRYEVSRILRKLVENLPEPPEVEENGQE